MSMPLYRHVYRPGVLAVVLLSIAVVATAILVAYSSSDARLLINELFIEVSLRDRLHADWGRLVLEHSTWSAHNRIEVLAVDKLGMHMPAPADVRVVVP